MTLTDLLLDLPPMELLQQLYLVFGTSINNSLNTIQETVFKNSQHKISSIQLVDGRYILSADILSEIGGGIYSGGFSLIPQEYYSQVDILSLQEVSLLLPDRGEESII